MNNLIFFIHLVNYFSTCVRFKVKGNVNIVKVETVELLYFNCVVAMVAIFNIPLKKG